MSPRNGNGALRSRQWFGVDNLQGLTHRAYLRAEGFTGRAFDGRPVVGICNSWSELTNCNTHLHQVAEAVKRGCGKRADSRSSSPPFRLVKC